MSKNYRTLNKLDVFFLQLYSIFFEDLKLCKIVYLFLAGCYPTTAVNFKSHRVFTIFDQSESTRY